MVEACIKEWLDKEARLFTDLYLPLHPLLKKQAVACIPIIPPGQDGEDPDLPKQDDDQPMGVGIENIREGYFEKYIKLVDMGGPPPRGKPKPPPMEPTTIGGEAAETIHRAISIRPR